MTEDQIKKQIAALQAQLEEIRAGKVDEIDVIQYENEAEREKLHQEDLQRIRGFRLIDDDFMNACFDGDIEGTELLLHIILGRPDIKVLNVKTQKLMKNLLGRDIWLDIDATDDSGQDFDIEIQRADRGASYKRARYHSSILDAHLLRPKDDFSKLPETYVIFITENDVIGSGEPIYTIERMITNINEPFNDGEHIIYVNGEDKNSATELGKLMHDFFCTNPDEMHYKHLADKVRYYKENEKGVAAMCRVMEEMRKEAAEKAAEKAAKEATERTKIELAINMIKDGTLSIEQIAKITMLALEQVQQLAAA